MPSRPLINRPVAWGFEKDYQRRIAEAYRQTGSSLTRKRETWVRAQLHPGSGPLSRSFPFREPQSPFAMRSSELEMHFPNISYAIAPLLGRHASFVIASLILFFTSTLFKS